MAERSKAPVSGTGLFGGVGSNPTPISFGFFAFARPLLFGNARRRGKKKKKVGIPTMGLEPTILPLGGARLIH